MGGQLIQNLVWIKYPISAICPVWVYTHKVYAQCSLDAIVVIIKTLGSSSPLEGYDVRTVLT